MQHDQYKYFLNNIIENATLVISSQKNYVYIVKPVQNGIEICMSDATPCDIKCTIISECVNMLGDNICINIGDSKIDIDKKNKKRKDVVNAIHDKVGDKEHVVTCLNI